MRRALIDATASFLAPCELWLSIAARPMTLRCPGWSEPSWTRGFTRGFAFHNEIRAFSGRCRAGWIQHILESKHPRPPPPPSCRLDRFADSVCACPLRTVNSTFVAFLFCNKRSSFMFPHVHVHFLFRRVSGSKPSNVVFGSIFIIHIKFNLFS